jgi:hypothetical protein
MQDKNDEEIQKALLLAGGASLMVLGAGMLLAHPAIRKTVLASLAPLLPQLEEPLKNGAAQVLPDLERYLKLKGM